MSENNVNLFRKLFTGKSNKYSERQLELIKSITDTNNELKLANENFNLAEGDLIDYYSYQIKAHKAKLDYLIKQLKQTGLELDIIHALKIGLYKDVAI